MNLLKISLLLLLSNVLCLSAQGPLSALLPLPNNILLSEGKYLKLDNQVGIYANSGSLDFSVKKIQQVIQEQMGLRLKPVSVLPDDKCTTIKLLIDPSIEDNEHYCLTVSEQEFSIRGRTPGAVYYGVVTLEQLLKGDHVRSRAREISAIRIDDNPRFAYRSLMLDPARHFLPVEGVKRFIDRMSKYKYNILQLHLTDDEGWRVEIKKYPLLTEVGACRVKDGSMDGPDNGFYTQEQLKELVRYAKDRNVEIVPEIDLPGHTVALLAAYPQLACEIPDSGVQRVIGKTVDQMVCCGNDSVYLFLKDIITEISMIFPSRYIHLGGDESVLNKNWDKCNRCRCLMKEKGYPEVHYLMKDFFQKVLSFIHEKNKQAMLWCELDNIYPPATDYLFEYPKDVILFSWRNGLTPACLEITGKYDHKLVMAPGEYAYLNRPQKEGDVPNFSNWKMPVTRLKGCYEFDPGYGKPQNEQDHILGVTGALWGEEIKDIDRAFYMAYPRCLALVEAAWTQMKYREWVSFKQRALFHVKEMKKEAINVGLVN